MSNNFTNPIALEIAEALKEEFGTTSNEWTDENGNPTTTTYTYSYSMSPLLGPGAKTWEASGTMKIYHDLTRAARTVTLATDAYGNPFSD